VGLALPLHHPVFQQFTGPVFEAATRNLLASGHLHEGAHPAWPYFAAWGIAALGTLVAWTMYAGPARELPPRLARTFPYVYRFAVDKFRVDELYEVLVIEPVKFAAYILWRIVDVFAIDGILVNGIARFVAFTGSVVRVAQNGDVQRYAAIMAMAAAVILWSVLGVGGR
jgi:NADH-quinone oxidoreductase subunit L